MITLPMTARILIQEKDRPRISLWLPLFLIWPFALIFGVLVTPFILMFMWLFGQIRSLKTLSVFFVESWRLIRALNGTSIEVKNKTSNVLIKIGGGTQ